MKHAHWVCPSSIAYLADLPGEAKAAASAQCAGVLTGAPVERIHGYASLMPGRGLTCDPDATLIVVCLRDRAALDHLPRLRRAGLRGPVVVLAEGELPRVATQRTTLGAAGHHAILTPPFRFLDLLWSVGCLAPLQRDTLAAMLHQMNAPSQFLKERVEPLLLRVEAGSSAWDVLSELGSLVVGLLNKSPVAGHRAVEELGVARLDEHICHCVDELLDNQPDAARKKMAACIRTALRCWGEAVLETGEYHAFQRRAQRREADSDSGRRAKRSRLSR